MAKDYKETVARITKSIGALGKENPSVLQGFQGLASAAMEPGSLDLKTKEFLALAIGVTMQCDGCIGFHMRKLHELGATREEIAEVLGVCVYMGGGPKLMYAAEAMHALDQFSS